MNQSNIDNIPDKKEHYRSIIILALPILVGQLGMILTGFVDTWMIGNYSTLSLAAASYVNNLFNVAIFAIIGFSYGLTPLVGIMFSRDEKNKIGETIKTGLLVNMLFAVIVIAIMSLIYFNIERLGPPAELLELIRPYFLVYLAGLTFICIFNVFAQWSYGITNTWIPMVIVMIANALNILLNWLLIGGNMGFPEMGLIGAGIATLVARVLCAVLIIFSFCCLKVNREYFRGFIEGRVNSRSVGRINRTSWPVALQMIFESGSFSFAVFAVGIFLGVLNVAAYQVIVITGTLGFCIYYSLGSAVSVLVANKAGSGDSDEMRRVAFAGYHIILAVATLSSLTFIFFGRNLMGFLGNNPEVTAIAMTCIFPLVLYQYADATQINFANALRGTSHVMPMLWIAFISYVIVGVPTTWILTGYTSMGLFGTILSFSVSLFLAAALFLYFFMRSTRKNLPL